MSSGIDSYERAFKLWISLWSLVLENKRHLESVCSVLQSLVYEHTEWPTYKNWPEICKLGQVDQMMMMAVATADLSSGKREVHRLIAAFPECFSCEEVTGPIPLSVIRAEGKASGVEEGETYGDDCPVSFDAPSLDKIPLQGFDKFGRRTAGFEGPILSEGIDPDTPQGGSVTWEGKEFVVVENNVSCEELWVVPAECIVVDC